MTKEFIRELQEELLEEMLKDSTSSNPGSPSNSGRPSNPGSSLNVQDTTVNQYFPDERCETS